jgi:hypothetical protein
MAPAAKLGGNTCVRLPHSNNRRTTVSKQKKTDAESSALASCCFHMGRKLLDEGEEEALDRDAHSGNGLPWMVGLVHIEVGSLFCC